MSFVVPDDGVLVADGGPRCFEQGLITRRDQNWRDLNEPIADSARL